MLDLLMSPEAWAALVTLTAMEIVLGIDNIVFLGVLTSRLPAAKAKRARQIGLALALIFRIVLLSALAWLMKSTEPLFELFGQGFSLRDIILIAGGGFLLVKSTLEIHSGIEGADEEQHDKVSEAAFGMLILQIVVIDAVFSIDSIITAIGMARDIEIMIAAVVIAIAAMYFAAGPVTDFISKHPTTRMLALSFLMLIGVALVVDGFGIHVPRGYIYSAMAFSALVEMLNVIARGRRERRRQLKSVR